MGKEIQRFYQIVKEQIALNALNSSRLYDTKKRSERIVSFFEDKSVI